jgi:hypothetical protein
LMATFCAGDLVVEESIKTADKTGIIFLITLDYKI